MRTLQIRSLSGPNLFASHPVLRMSIDLEEQAQMRSSDVPGFSERLLAALPGLSERRPPDTGSAKEQPEGSAVEFHEGAEFGRIVEQVAVEMSRLAGVPVRFSTTVCTGEPGRCQVVVGVSCEQTLRLLLGAAVDLVNALIRQAPYPLEETLREARELAADVALGPSTRAIVNAAEARNIPWSRLNDQSLIVLGYGKNRRFIQATTSSRTSFVAVDIASDKQLTKELLARSGISVPRGVVVRTEEQAVAALAEIEGPVVIKPLDGNHGNGVSLNVTTEAEARRAFAIAREYRSRILVEQMIEGRNYRVLVVGGKLVAASERLPAHVTGDGVHTVAELIEIENQNPLRAEGHSGALTRLEVDAVVTLYLEKTGRSLSDVPAPGECFLLRESVNLSTGGTARDVTDEVHPEVARMCERAARAIDLDICGIDLVARDIRRPVSNGCAVIELNAAPGIRMHQYPSEGRARDAGAAIVDMLYPPGSPARIPIISITGTNGKTTTTRMIGHILGATGARIGMTTTDGIYIGGRLIQEGDTTGPQSARTVLFDPSVDIAVLETARGGIVRRGLGYDWSDVAVLMNVQGDHLGQDGINTIEDLFRVKSLVAERVRAGGTLILNAEDPRLAALPSSPRMQSIPRRIVFFALDPRCAVLERHVAAGGLGYTLKNDWIVELNGLRETRILRASRLPSSFRGTALFQVANAMASIAAARACGARVATIADALLSFESIGQNPGRLNLYHVGPGYALVDYGHNPGSYEAICAMASRWKGHKLTAVIGAPGDRLDQTLEESARIAARTMHRIIVKEDHNLRGRAPGEIASIMMRAVLEDARGLECAIELDEAAAIRRALSTMEDGEVVMIFTDDRPGVVRVLLEHGAMAAEEIEEGAPFSAEQAFNESPRMTG